MRCASPRDAGRALLLAVLLCTNACAGLQVDRGPDLFLADLKLTDLTLLETSGVLTVRLANENLETMIVTGGVYELSLGGIKIGKGLSDRRVEVPKLGTETLEVDLHISNLALATRIRELIETRSVEYRLQGKVYVQRPTGTRRYKVRKTGRFDFAEGDFQTSG